MMPALAFVRSNLDNIPSGVIRKSPLECSAADRTDWCHHYMRGLLGIEPHPDAHVTGIDWAHIAHQMGQQDARLPVYGPLAAQCRQYQDKSDAL